MKKKIIAVLCTIITVIPLVLSTPKADNTYTTHTTPTVTSYGQYYSSSSYFEDLVSYTLGPADLTIPVSNATSFTFVYEFKDTYDGYINLSLTAVNSFAWNTTYFYCEGCTLIQQPNMSNVSQVKTFGLQFQSAKKISFTVIHETQNSGIVNPDKIFYDWSVGTTTTFSITSSSFTLQPNVADDLNYIKGRFDYYVPGMSTSLSNIATDIDNIDTNIATLLTYVDNVETYLTQLKGYVDGIEGYIDGIESTLTNIYSKVNTMSSSITSINTNITKLLYMENIPEYSIPAHLWAFRQPAGTTNLSISGTFGNVYPYYQFMPSNYDGVYTSSNSLIARQEPLYFVWISPSTADFGEFGHPSNSVRIIPQVANTNENWITFYSWGINCVRIGSYNVHFVSVYTNTGGRSFELELHPTLTGSGPQGSYLLISPIYVGYGNNMPDEVRSLIRLEYDNTYTRLLQSINNGISVLNGDYDTSQYESYEQTIDNLNDNMRDRFNSSETSFQNNINSILTPDQNAGGSNTIFEQFNFNVINGLFTSFLGQLFNAAPLLQYLLLFSLLLLVLGVFI